MAYMNQKYFQSELVRITYTSFLKLKIKEAKTNINRLALETHTPRQTFYKQVMDTDPPLSVVLLFSNLLRVNLFEYFLQLMPEDIQPTRKEKELQAKYDALLKEHEIVKRERDLMERILTKGKE